MPFNPFHVDALSQIFKFDEENQHRLISRENGRLEFKESFNMGSADDYAKTAAAFANSQGGYLVFGVKDQPREIVGLKGTKFHQLDVAKVTQAFAERFSPEIHWEPHVQKVGQFEVGILYISEAATKPVVCLREGGNLQGGAIYYRYRGRSERIRFPELRALLDSEIAKERELWVQYLQKMAKVGIRNVGVLNTISGEVTAGSNSFLIPAELVRELQIVRSGHFVEDGGAPALKLIGTLQTVNGEMIQPATTIPTSIGELDIVSAFVSKTEVLAPDEYLRQVCHGSTANLPIYWFATQTDLSREDLSAEISKVKSRGPVKQKLLDRIANIESLSKFRMGTINANSPAAKERKQLSDSIRQKEVNTSDLLGNTMRFSEAITQLDRSEYDLNYLLSVLRLYMIPKFDALNSAELSAFRKALCYLDLDWYGEKWNS